METQLEQAKKKNVLLEQKIAKLQQKLSEMPPVLRKTLSDLTDSKYLNLRIQEIEQQQLGPEYQIVKREDTEELSKPSYLAFQRIHRLSNKTVNALSKIPKSTWPSIDQLRYCEKNIIKECGGFTEEKIKDVKMIWATDPIKAFFCYLETYKKLIGMATSRCI